MIYYGCPKCQAPMGSPESMAGQADTCPTCGNVTAVPTSPRNPAVTLAPTSGSSYEPTHAGRIIGIERTSKRLKLHSLLSTMLLATGVIMVVADWPHEGSAGWAFGIGAISILIGIVWQLLTRVRIWWRHG